MPPTVFGGEGFLDVRFVVKHGRSLEEGSSALERLLAGVQCVRSCVRVSAIYIQTALLFYSNYQDFYNLLCYTLIVPER